MKSGKKQVAWITGITGYTGSRLSRYLKETEPDLTLVGLARSPQFAQRGVKAYFSVDLQDIPSIRAVAESFPPAVVFHLAGLSPPADPASMWTVNVGGTVSLLQALVQSTGSAIRFIGAGSAAEYVSSADGRMTEESPTGGETAYGRTKWAQTTLTLVLAEALGVSASILRPFNVIGPHLGNRLVAGRICEQVVREAYAQIELGNLSSERDFIDIRDVIQAYHHVYRNGEPGEIYNVCTGVPTRIDLLVRRFKEATGIQKKVVSNAERFRDVDLDRVYGANDKIVSTGWRPTVSLEQSVADMVRAATG